MAKDVFELAGGDTHGMTPHQVKQIRKRAKLTQKQFAEKLGVSRWTVVSWECGRRPILPRMEEMRARMEEMRAIEQRLYKI